MKISRMRQRRLDLKMTQIDVANRTGLSIPTVRLAESGYHGVSTRAKKRIAKALDCGVNEIFEACNGSAADNPSSR